MRIDVNAFVGAYPFRRVPGTSPEALLAAMDRSGLDEAWVTHLPGVFWRDPTEGNAWLLGLAGRYPRLRPVPAVHPGLADWSVTLRRAADVGAPAVRADPTFYGIDPARAAMRALAVACGEAGMPLSLAVRLEDGRQRHPNDHAPELPAAAVRALIRSDPRVRLLVTHADRPFVELAADVGGTIGRPRRRKAPRSSAASRAIGSQGTSAAPVRSGRASTAPAAERPASARLRNVAWR